MGRVRTQTQRSQAESSRQSSQADVSQCSAFNQTVETDVEIITLTRCILLNRCMTEEEMIATYVQIYENDPMSHNFRNVLREINQSLQECKIKIVEGNCEITDKKYYLAIPTYFKPTQVWPSNLFRDTELNFIKTLISEIIVSDVGVVTLERVVEKHKFINNDDGKNVIKKLVKQCYLIEPKKGKYALSVLAMCELEPYFHYTYKDTLKKCSFCKRIMFFGGFCQNCRSSGHFSCLTKYKQSMQKKPLKCPSCNKEWSRNATNADLEQILDHEDIMDIDEND